MFGLRAVVDRCGVIAGPWQMGKVDQGVFAHWLLSHHFGRPLSYIGYGGTGKQVRDLIHVARPRRIWSSEQLARARPLGRRGAQRGRRPGAQSLAARDDGSLPRADRERGAGSPPSWRDGPETSPSTSRTVRVSSSAPTGARPGPPGTRSPIWRRGSSEYADRVAGQPRVRGGDRGQGLTNGRRGRQRLRRAGRIGVRPAARRVGLGRDRARMRSARRVLRTGGVDRAGQRRSSTIATTSSGG